MLRNDHARNCLQAARALSRSEVSSPLSLATVVPYASRSPLLCVAWRGVSERNSEVWKREGKKPSAVLVVKNCSASGLLSWNKYPSRVAPHGPSPTLPARFTGPKNHLRPGMRAARARCRMPFPSLGVSSLSRRAFSAYGIQSDTFLFDSTPPHARQTRIQSRGVSAGAEGSARVKKKPGRSGGTCRARTGKGMSLY